MCAGIDVKYGPSHIMRLFRLFFRIGSVLSPSHAPVTAGSGSIERLFSQGK